MADDAPSKPLPDADDQKRAIELRHYIDDNQLKGRPYFGERCDNCQYYLNPDDKFSYCWHPKIRAAVGGPWWCQWWEAILDDSATDDVLTQLEPKEVDEQKAEQLQVLTDAVTLKGVPYGDQRCDNCHYYHMDPQNPDTEAKIAYCWHDKLRILVGDDWWCERWAEIGKPE